jgi:hypothetical protein
MVEMGTYRELLVSSSSFRRLLENIHQQEEEEQIEQPINVSSRRETRCVTFSETETDVLRSSTANIEKKHEGSVHWQVYVAYIRAGAGVVVGILSVVVLFGGFEATTIFYNWWLAKWSENQSYRYRQWPNCSAANNSAVDAVRSMNDSAWNNYQEQKFYIYAGS